MSKRDPISQAQNLEKKIKEMQEKQQRYIEKAQREIGEYLMNTWDVEDIQQSKLLIDKLKDQAQDYFKENHQGNNENNKYSPDNNG